MKKSFHKGFTLIELLVVVAIIALLAATILASLGSARTKARDARTTSELSSMRAQAELYSNNHGFSYGTAGSSCTSTNNIFDTTSTTTDSVAKLMADILANALGGTSSTASTNVACGTTGTAWYVAAQLQSGSYFCVDSNGSSKATAAATGVSLSTVANSTTDQCN